MCAETPKIFKVGSWSVAETVRDERHELGMRGERVRRHAGVLPHALEYLGQVGARYFATLAATRRSIRTEEQRLVLLVELFGATATASAIDEVMKTGHVGAEYVEHVMRFKRKLAPAPPALRLGVPALDAINLPEPDLTRYDDIAQRRPLRDPGDPPQSSDEQEST